MKRVVFLVICVLLALVTCHQSGVFSTNKINKMSNEPCPELPILTIKDAISFAIHCDVVLEAIQEAQQHTRWMIQVDEKTCDPWLVTIQPELCTEVFKITVSFDEVGSFIIIKINIQHHTLIYHLT